MSSLSDAAKVQEFTVGAQGPTPNTPSPMSESEVSFIIRMCLSELLELAQTVTTTDEEAVQYLKDRVKTDLSPYERPDPNDSDTPDRLAADQADAAVDVMYYLYNSFGKKGINLSKVFDVVHNANMAKRDPKTMQFIKRESDGKVLKPEGWQAPDILAEIKKQKENGAWN